MEITSKRIALLNTLPFIYMRKSKDDPVVIVRSVIMFGDDISILLQDGGTVQVSREWRNEDWFIYDLTSSNRYVLMLAENMRVVFCALRPLTPQLLARHRLAGIQ